MASFHYGRPEPPVFKQNGFELRDQTFTVSGYERFDSQRLREVLYPQPQLTQSTGQESVFRRATEALRHRLPPINPGRRDTHPTRGVNSSGQSTREKGSLRLSLDADWSHQQCEQISDSAIEVQQKMKRDDEPQRQEWANEFRVWDESNKAKCNTPQKRAEYDFEWFLSHHYFTDGREPDRTKTPDVLVLQGFDHKRDLIARTIPGLHTALCRSRDEFTETPDLCIGWDEASVVRKVQDTNNEVEEERQRKEDRELKKRDEHWQKDIEPHRRYLHRRHTMNTPPLQSFELRHCVGSYLVRCDEIAKKEWWCSPRMLHLDISLGPDGILIGTFDFNLIEGTMLLGFSEEKLDELVARIEGKERRRREREAKRNRYRCHKHEDCWEDYPSDLDDDDEEEEEEEEEDELNACAAGTKRAAPDTTTTPSSSPASKRQRTTPSNAIHLPRRIFYRMHGREAGDEMIKRRPEYFSSPCAGLLHFADDACTAFSGMLDDNEFVGENVRFVGCKVPDVPQWSADPWSTFSGRHSWLF
ncbi:uncharacterized protein J3D65DRAFT_272101 [Phyllosticta citribraziliensis]|uniref:Uncharacterized protein n=1 Tax=Phyllosticta citribraziliensis TaxID=989973 RepID=A0ABR1M1A2_9PEZI